MSLETLLVEWAVKYDVETVLERIVGRGASACDPLATRGKRVTMARDDGPLLIATVDLVVVHGDEAPPSGGGAWAEWLLGWAKRASKLVVIETENPRPPSLFTRLTGSAHGGSSWGSTAGLAPVLWEMGRVREHAFFGVADGVSRKKAARTAARHAFVIDVTPRTPQARRRVRLETV